MKKYLYFLIFVPIIFLFSGCSLGGGTTSLASSIWKTTDGGKTWQGLKSDNVNLASADILSMSVAEQKILVGLLNPGILESDDAGESWSSLKWQSEKVYGLAVDPKDSQVIYASGVWQKRGKLFKSFDGGENWEEVYTTPSSGLLVISMVVRDQTIYISTSDKQLLRSTDGGKTWKNIYTAQSPILRVALGNSDNLIFFIAQGGGFFRSSDGGTTFSDISQVAGESLIGRASLNVLEVDSSTGWIYAAGASGIIRSKDSGQTWGKITSLSSPDTFPVDALAISPSNSSEIVYASGQAFYKSTDEGQTWSTSQFEGNKKARVIKYDPADAQTIYVGFWSGN